MIKFFFFVFQTKTRFSRVPVAVIRTHGVPIEPSPNAQSIDAKKHPDFPPLILIHLFTSQDPTEFRAYPPMVILRQGFSLQKMGRLSTRDDQGCESDIGIDGRKSGSLTHQ
jgi:hypothetical protein